MNDSDIRAVLLTNFGQEYGNDPNTMIVEELGLCQGEARVDVAVINGSIHGFEIKSDQDTLKRLPGQMNIYNRSLDFVTLVVGGRHLTKSLEIIPKWWGVICVQQRNKKLIMDDIRPHKANPSPDPEAIVQLIWRNEALEVLRRRNLHKGYLSK
ncbi:MAG: sce7726 family protein, partial [Deltaproteobacteria bacterium]|nr:sce7726 family protein [Deltaproteobacteria bacterium]